MNKNLLSHEQMCRKKNMACYTIEARRDHKDISLTCTVIIKIQQHQ